MHGSGFKKQIFIEVVKVNKVIMMKTCSCSLKYPNNKILLSSYLMICQKIQTLGSPIDGEQK
jgi:hypothetical protein